MKTSIELVAILTFFVFIQPVYAEIYKWTDDKGGVHFTEDPFTIPDKYRDKVKSRETEEDKLTPQEKARTKQPQERVQQPQRPHVQ
jgi:hypothetical protein